MRHSPERRPSPTRIRSRSRMSAQGGAAGMPMSPPLVHPMQMHQMQMAPMMMPMSPADGGPHMMMGGPPPPPPRNDEEPTPICRCRVLYLGSAVPHVTKDGLQGIQEPLKELYPEDGALGAKGIDSWLSVWSNGFLLENMDENRKKVSRFFPIESLHYCAAVRYVLVPGSSVNPAAASNGPPPGSSNNNTLTKDKSAQPRFLPLDSPFARNPNINHPPLFAAILRRTTGIKVLECHVFICKRETAANALVRCSFHSYADSTYAKHLESGQSIYGTLGGPTPIPSATPTPGGMTAEMNLAPMPQMSGASMMRAETPREYQQSVIEVSEDSINSIEKVEEWKVLENGTSTPHHLNNGGGNLSSNAAGGRILMTNGASPRENGNGTAGPEEISVFNGDENHKVWAGKTPEPPEGIYDYGTSTLRSFRSTVSTTSHRNRPRQMLMPSSPPPPPIPEEKEDAAGGGHAHKKESKKKKKRSKSRDALDSGAPPPPHLAYLGMNGSVLNGGAPPSRKHSSSGSLMGVPRMMNGHGPPRGNGVPPMPMPMKSGTFTGRGKKNKQGPPPTHPPPHLPPFMMYGGPGGHPNPYGMPPPGPPPHLMPPPGHPLYGGMPPHVQPMYGGAPPPPHLMRPGSRAMMEEPIYMPHNARPLSPVASYQPGHFPHEAYYNQQQYATIDKANKPHKKGGGGGGGGGKNKKGSSKNTPIISSDSNAEDSEFGAGIYKKGHINERAFSYSIRNEHRSRSYGSLSNMQFGPNGEPLPPHELVNGGSGGDSDSHQNGGGGGGGEEVDGPPGPPKHKEREFYHMMSELELGDDTIERREVPPGFYPPNGRGPRMGPPPPHPGMMMMPPPPEAMIMGGGPPPGRKKR